MTFIGRKKEIALLQDIIKRKTASLIVLRGRRRIGKSTLAKEVAAQTKGYFFSGLPPKDNTTAQIQRDNFARQLKRELNIPLPRADDWGDLLWILVENTKTEKCIIVLDEITWLGGMDTNFLGQLKIAWDDRFKRNVNLTMILSGSVSGWIEKNILSDTGFFGRISLDLKLEELPLFECTKFWGHYAKNVSAYDKLKILAVTGGVPRYLEEVHMQHSAEANIERLCFDKNGIMFDEFDRIFSDLFDRRANIYKKIVTRLADGSAQLADIYTSLGTDKSGSISEYVNDLVEAGFLSRDYSWKIKDGKVSKLSNIRLKDNYVRFYLKYIEPNKQRILKGSFVMPSNFSNILGLQFENLVLANMHVIWDALNISQDSIVMSNAFFQKNTQRYRGCQVDCMIQTKDGVLYVCEVKFMKNPIGREVIGQMQDKIDRIVVPKSFSKRPVLIHVNGVMEAVEDADYFAEIIPFDRFLAPN